MNRIALISAATLGLVVGGGITAAAAIPSSDGTITACYVKPTSNLRVIDGDTATCKKGESKLTWNQAGQAGTNGVSGFEEVEAQDTHTLGSGVGGFIESARCPAGKVATGGGGQASVVLPDNSVEIPVINSTEVVNDTNVDYHGFNVGFVRNGGGTFPSGSVVHWFTDVTCIIAN
ncbi:MAG TPA: hypothetical protein VFJ89_11540 [Nocardioides sp.]|nr:hypothetical protein [Nocardioides sp.]